MSIVPEIEAPPAPPPPADGAGLPPVDPDVAEFIARMKARTPEQLAADRVRILASSPPPHPIPEGKTWMDMVCGKWPGDETDEEIEEWLRNRKRVN